MGRYLELLDSAATRDASAVSSGATVGGGAAPAPPPPESQQAAEEAATKATKAPTCAGHDTPDARRRRVLDMSLADFARQHLALELRVPGCTETVWWVPNSRAAEEPSQAGQDSRELATAAPPRTALDFLPHKRTPVSR